ARSEAALRVRGCIQCGQAQFADCRQRGTIAVLNDAVRIFGLHDFSSHCVVGVHDLAPHVRPATLDIFAESRPYP
ncbi:MAG: hypothetical protein ABSB70_23410, partial [Candidatus Velthaea sp.]